MAGVTAPSLELPRAVPKCRNREMASDESDEQEAWFHAD